MFRFSLVHPRHDVQRVSKIEGVHVTLTGPNSPSPPTYIFCLYSYLRKGFRQIDVLGIGDSNNLSCVKPLTILTSINLNVSEGIVPNFLPTPLPSSVPSLWRLTYFYSNFLSRRISLLSVEPDTRRVSMSSLYELNSKFRVILGVTSPRRQCNRTERIYLFGVTPIWMGSFLTEKKKKSLKVIVTFNSVEPGLNSR